MKSNEDKCHLFVVNTEVVTVKLGNEILSACSSIALLRITIDNSLNFSEYVSNLCKKGSQKLHALARVSKYLTLYLLNIYRMKEKNIFIHFFTVTGIGI